MYALWYVIKIFSVHVMTRQILWKCSCPVLSIHHAHEEDAG